jgi:hypothetical protein
MNPFNKVNLPITLIMFLMSFAYFSLFSVIFGPLF